MSFRGRVSLAAVFFLLVLSSSAQAASNCYLKFEDPSIAGSSTAAGHEKEIEILTWNHGFNQPTSPARSTAGRGSVEQAAHSNLTFTKYVDSGTDDLLKFHWSGRQIGKATLTCFRASGADDNKPVAYLTIRMENVIISNYSVSGGPGDIPVENVSLDYGSIQYTYKERNHAEPESAKLNRRTGKID